MKMRLESKTFARLAGVLLLLLGTGAALAQDGKQPWEEYDKLINKRKAVTALGDDMFGDRVDLASGSLSFSHTDVSLTGNNALPVAVTRTFNVVSDKERPNYSFGDWDIDIPNISGLFAPMWHDNRCDVAIPPSKTVGAQVGDVGAIEDVPGDRYWKGNSANMPNGGELLRVLPAIPATATTPAIPGTPVRSTGGPWVWVTSGRTLFKCVTNGVANATGQGFEAVTPDGTRYVFAHMARYRASKYNFTWQIPSHVGQPAAYASADLDRAKNALYVTRVEDRFGNWVNYSYANAYDQPLKINSITSSDGRTIAFTYDAYNQIKTITANGRIWKYNYAGANYTLQVEQPDGGKWDIAFAPLASANIEYLGTQDPNWRTCFFLGALDNTGPIVGTITHPSGAVGKFTVEPRVHGRSNVPAICEYYIPASAGWNDKTNDYAIFPIKWHAMSLTQKQISGPGMPTQTWDFSYSNKSSWFIPDGAAEPYKCDSLTCADPVCLEDACAGTATTTIVGPDATSWKRYTFGNSYRYNEGKLLKIEEGASASQILRTTTKVYELSQVRSEYPVQVGESPLVVNDSFTSEFPRPEVASTVTQQDVTFTRSTETGCTTAGIYCLDAFLRPTKARRYSSLGYSTTEVTEYYDHSALWVLGQVKKVTELGTGLVVKQTGFDGATALPLQNYSFGLLQNTLGYNADGTLATVTDGRGYVTKLSSWKLGIPQQIEYPGTTATFEKAQVNASGDIDWTEDELAYRTIYGYDAIGRLASIAYPTGDTVAWNPTTTPFVPVTVAQYGVAVGQWKQTIKTGNGQATTFYDAHWRPVLVLTEDTALTASKTFVVTRYNASGQAIFTSYPVASISDYKTDALQGTYTDYDALGRVIGTRQDSELGVLTTTTQYLTGFQTRTTNARNYVTNTMYQAFDTPNTDAPVQIQALEGVTTLITRDVFGAPLTVTRSGPGG
jgi:YD repeat-containing protein